MPRRYPRAVAAHEVRPGSPPPWRCRLADRPPPQAEGWFQIVELVAIAVAVLIGFGVIHLPNFEQLLEDAGKALGPWTYLAVGVLAFLETGAFLGFIAPGETAVIVGGLVAGQGEISLLALIAIVWTCCLLGDTVSYGSAAARAATGCSSTAPAADHRGASRPGREASSNATAR